MRNLYNIGLEQNILATLMSALDASISNKIGDLTADDFHAGKHKIIFETIKSLMNSGDSFDPVMVLTSIQEQGLEKETGGEEYLMKLVTNYGGIQSNLESYSKSLIALSKKRQIFNELQNAQQALLEADADTNVDDVWGRASSNINNVLTSQSEKTHFTSIEAYEKWVESVYEKSITTEEAGVKTGFTDLDEKAVIGAGDLVVIAGRSGMGKTTFSQNVFTHIARHEDGVAVYFSIEMSAEDLTARIYSDKANIYMKKAFTGKGLTEDDWAGIQRSIVDAQQMNFIIDDRSTITTGQMRTFLNNVKLEHGKISAVFVDYMQLIKPSNPKDMRERQVALISSDLKAIGKDFGCPVYALSQLNRSLESRPNKRPIMSDLRESGAIEQDASVIMFIYRDEVYNPDSKHQGIAEIIIGKNRNGERGTAFVGFNGGHSRFENIDVSTINAEEEIPEKFMKGYAKQ